MRDRLARQRQIDLPSGRSCQFLPMVGGVNWRLTPAPPNQDQMFRTFLSTTLLVATALVFPAPADAKEPKVLLIGVDGMRVDAFQKAKTPALDRLIADGIVDWQTSVISTDVTTSDTVSGPGWTTFLTGVWADRHGVVDNSFEGRNARLGPHCFHLAKQANSDLLTASFLDWTPLQTHVTTDADINVVVTPRPAWQEYDGGDQVLTDTACVVLKSQPIDFAFVYLGSVDEAGHKHGFHPSVDPYVQRIEATDALIARLVSAVQSRPNYDQEDWLFVVSSDHGGEGTGHGDGRDKPTIHRVAMIVSGDAAARGDDVAREVATTDIVAVALTHLNVKIVPEWNLAGSSDGWLK